MTLNIARRRWCKLALANIFPIFGSHLHEAPAGHARFINLLKVFVFLFAIVLALTAAGSPAWARASSPSGTTIPSAAQIVDSSLNVWTVSAGSIYENGKTAGYSANVSLLLYFNGTIYQENHAGDWWSWTSSKWVASSDPRKKIITSSPSGTTIPSAAQIVDSSLNVWTVSGGTIYKNGATMGYSANVTLLLYYNGTIYQENHAGDWWSWNGGTWVASSDPRGTTAAVNGACGNANNVAVSTAPRTGLCSTGVASGITGNGPWNWSCAGSNGGTTASCSAPLSNQVVNGECGSVLGTCSAGTAINVTNATGDVTWTCEGSGGGTNASCNIVTLPSSVQLPPAVRALGYTNPVFFDDFSNINATIDLNNTQEVNNPEGQPYKWYIQSPFNKSQPSPKSNYSTVMVGSTPVLKFDKSGGSINTLIRNTSTGAPVGTSFAMHNNGGAYYEASIAMTAVQAGVSGWPAFWAESAGHIKSEGADHWIGNPDPKYVHYAEIDTMELNWCNNQVAQTMIDWFGHSGETSCPGSGVSKGYCKEQDGPQCDGHADGGFTSTEEKPVFHRFGTLWVPSVNGSTGYVQWYIDGNPVGEPITWVGHPPEDIFLPASPWRYSIADEEGFALSVNTGGGSYMYVAYVGVWQLP